MVITKNIGMLLLAVWLILTGLSALIGLALPNAGQVLGVLALVAGILILVGR